MELTFFDLNLRTLSYWSKILSTFIIQNWVDHVVNLIHIKTLHYVSNNQQCSSSISWIFTTGFSQF